MIGFYIGLVLFFLFFLVILFFLLRPTCFSKIALIGVVSISSGVGYYYYGAMIPLKSLYAYREVHSLLQTLQKNSKTRQETVDQELSTLYNKLPQTEYVHAKLGELYLALNLSIKAEAAYQKAMDINKNNREYLYGYYYAQSLNHHGILPEKSIQALLKLIELYPEDNGFLNLAAVNYFQTKQYEQSIKYWKDIRSKNPEEARLIQFMLEQAKKQMGQTLISSPSIKIRVKWNYPEIKKYAVVFLVVKYPNDVKPILVKKLRVDQDIVAGQEQAYILSNQDTMDSTRTLEKGKNVIVSLRGTISGIADKATQDKVVESQALLLNQDQLELKIIF